MSIIRSYSRLFEYEKEKVSVLRCIVALTKTPYMRILTLFIFIFGLLNFNVIGQVPTQAEDISPLLISEKLPEALLMDTEGISQSLKSIISEQNTILLFYRGGWCPYCTSHLAAVGEVEDEITALGYQIMAISPDAPSKNDLTGEKVKANYTLYTDPGGALMKAMGIAFQAPERYKDRLLDFSDDMNPGLLPVPSIFVVSKTGTILFEFISPDYKQRMESDLLMAVLENLNN